MRDKLEAGNIENPLLAIVLGLFGFVCFLFNLLTFQKFHRPNAAEAI
jgi:hypothetical protein